MVVLPVVEVGSKTDTMVRNPVGGPWRKWIAATKSIEEVRTRWEPSVLQHIIDNSSACIYVKDLDGKYLHINRQFERVFHVRREEVIGQSDYDLFPPRLAEAFQRNDQTVLQTGKLLECEEVAPHDDGLHTYLTIKFPLRDDDGKIYALSGISTDITERLRAQQAIEALRHRTELLLECVGDGICGIDADGVLTFLNSAAGRLLNWPIAQLVGRPLSEVLPLPYGCLKQGPLSYVLNQGERRHVEYAEIVRIDGSRVPIEYVASPVYDSGRLTGAVLAMRDLRDRLESRRAEEEMQAASRVQQFLYPRTSPVIPGFDVAGGTYPSARVCGDYFDFIPWGPSTWCFTLGDVSGHGLGPALQMVETRAFLRAALQGTDSPGLALQRLNQTLCADLPEGMFVSLFVAQICTATRRFCYSSAGHPAGLMRHDGSLLPLKTTGFLLGLIENAAYPTTEMVDLHPGDVLVITSDGVAEMVSPGQTLFGNDRLWRTIYAHRDASAVAIRDAIHQDAMTFAAGEPQHDDVTILVAKCLPY